MKKLFGTDGVRGLANTHPISAEIALRLGQAAAEIFRNGKPRPKILIGKDTRLSGYMIEYALTSGIISMGADVLLVGPMPTPAIAHLTKSFAADCGIVISASHNNFEDNGIKFFDKDGYKLNDEKEKMIENLVFGEKIETKNYVGEKIGRAHRIDAAAGRYIEFAKSTIKNKVLKGLRIVVDCANGAAYKIAPLIFEELGAQVIVLNNRPNGKNINMSCGALYPEIIKQRVLEEKADLGIALDGDADRVILVDEKGGVLDGDHILAILAEYLFEKKKLRNNIVVSTVMNNVGLKKFLEAKNIKLVQTAVGDRYVIEEMKNNDFVLGGEQSGHIILSDHTTTGDGTITALQILMILKEKKVRLSELRNKLVKYPQVLINVKVKEKKPLDELKETSYLVKDFSKNLDGRILVRYSGTENLCRVMVEGSDEEEIKRIADTISKKIVEETN
ncbi:phosphoglucosamine mutase [Candidatus Woesearchaeota archaeon]|nr:phosphoglucosamine mutase [Candidatus Woesearchaeota archaeon]